MVPASRPPNTLRYQPLWAATHHGLWWSGEEMCSLSLLPVTSSTLDWWCARYQLSAGWEVLSLWQRRNTAWRVRVITDWKISENMKTFAGFSQPKCCLITIRRSSVYRLHLQFSSGSLFYSVPRLAFCFYDKFLSIRDTESLMRNLEGMNLRGLEKKKKRHLEIKRIAISKRKGEPKFTTLLRNKTSSTVWGVFFFWRLAERLTLCDTVRDLQCVISYYSQAELV